MDAVFTDVIAEKLDGWLMEGTFLRLEDEVMFSEALEDLSNVMAMFGQARGIDQDIIDVDDHGKMKEFPEHLMHKVLEYGGGIYQTLRHDQVLVVSSGGHKGRLPFVALTYPDEVIRAAAVQLSERGCSTKMFQGCWDERKWVLELYDDVVECSIVYAG